MSTSAGYEKSALSLRMTLIFDIMVYLSYVDDYTNFVVVYIMRVLFCF